MIYDRAHHRDLNRFGGLKEPMPLYCGLSGDPVLRVDGPAGLVRVRRRVSVLMAAWNFSPGLAVPAILSVILTAGYLLWTWQRVYLGTNPTRRITRNSAARGGGAAAVRGAGHSSLGILPQTLIFNWVDPSMTGWVANMSVP